MRSLTHRKLGQLNKAEADLKKANQLAGKVTAQPPTSQRPPSSPDGLPRQGASSVEVNILDIDKQLQKQSLAERQNMIRNLLSQATSSLAKGNVQSAVRKFWHARQLLVEKTVPTRAWLKLQVEVTDGERELQRYKNFVGRLNAVDHQRWFGGVRVRRVLPGSSAARAGLKPGQRILKINQQPVGRLEDVEKVLSDGTRTNRLEIADNAGEIKTIEISR